jgi:hypothetical protein
MYFNPDVTSVALVLSILHPPESEG